MLRRTMHEVMPTLNPLFEKVYSDSSVDIDSNFETVMTTDNSGKNLLSTTPQTQLSGVENYATQLTESQEGGTQTTSGRRATVGDMMTNWATSINNPLYLLYNELEPCFLQIF